MRNLPQIAAQVTFPGDIMVDKEDHDQLQPEGNKKDSDVEGEVELKETADRTLLCGWGKWRPNWLQPLSRPSVFLIFIFIFALTAGKNILQ